MRAIRPAPGRRDHGSTYRPLLDWYETNPCEVRRYDNDGPHGFFVRRDHLRERGPFVHTDCDLDLSRVPADAVDVMLRAYDANPWATKAGLSLEIEDIPDGLPWAGEVRGWESYFWRERTPDGNFVAPLDGTFALYDSGRRNPADDFYRAVRLDRPYTARHRPWYLTRGDASDPEIANYFGVPSAQSHWSRRVGAGLGLQHIAGQKQ